MNRGGLVKKNAYPQGGGGEKGRGKGGEPEGKRVEEGKQRERGEAAAEVTFLDGGKKESKPGTWSSKISSVIEQISKAEREGLYVTM